MYTVEIKVAKSQVFYLDGIRIYNPIDVNDNSEDASEAKNAYDEAKESNACLLYTSPSPRDRG